MDLRSLPNILQTNQEISVIIVHWEKIHPKLILDKQNLPPINLIKLKYHLQNKFLLGASSTANRPPLTSIQSIQEIRIRINLLTNIREVLWRTLMCQLETNLNQEELRSLSLKNMKGHKCSLWFLIPHIRFQIMDFLRMRMKSFREP